MNFLNIFFHYAPHSLCVELTNILLRLDKNTAISLLLDKENKNEFSTYSSSKKDTREANLASISMIKSIFNSQPDEMQNKFSDWICSLTSAQLKKFLGKDFPYYFFHDLDNGSIAPVKLLKAFQKLAPDIIRDFFCDNGYIVSIFNSGVYEPIAIEFLNLLEKNLNHQDLLRAFQGSDNYNLFHSLFFHNTRESVIKKALQLADCFTDSEMKKLLTSAAKAQAAPGSIILNPDPEAKTPLRMIWTNHNAIRPIMYLMQKRPTLRQLLTLKQGDYSPIQLAIISGNKEMVAYLLEQKELASLHNKELASHYNAELMLTKLYPRKFIIELFEAYPLYQAIHNQDNYDVRKKSLEAFVPLIKNNPKLLKVTWANEKTLLHHAAKLGDEFTLLFLLKLGADINAKDAEGKTPLDEAIAAGQSPLIRLLLSKKLDLFNLSELNRDDFYTFLLLLHNDPEIFSKIVHQSGANSSISGIELSHFKFTNQGFESFLSLLPLLPQLQTLTFKGCYLNGDNMEQLAPLLITPFFQEVCKGNVSAVRKLLQKNIVDADKQNVLYWALKVACQQNNLEMVKLLLSQGVCLELRDGNRTPLMIACDKGQMELVSYLLEKGADKSFETQSGETALTIAKKIGNDELINCLECLKKPLSKNIEISPQNYVLIRMWPPKVGSKEKTYTGAYLLGNVGHLSMSIHHGKEEKYLSHWPTKKPYLNAVPGAQNTLVDDIDKEGGPPTQYIPLYGLDTEAMIDKFEAVKNSKWKLRASTHNDLNESNKDETYNCASIVYTVLEAGGLFDYYLNDEDKLAGIMTPREVAALADKAQKKISTPFPSTQNMPKESIKAEFMAKAELGTYYLGLFKEKYVDYEKRCKELLSESEYHNFDKKVKDIAAKADPQNRKIQGNKLLNLSST